MRRFRKWKRWTAAAGLLLLGVIFFLFKKFTSAPLGPPVQILSGPLIISPSARDKFSMTLGPNRPWVTRLEEKLFGQRPIINLNSEIISFPAGTILTPEFDSPIYEGTNGLKVWFLTPDQLKRVNESLSRITFPDLHAYPQLETSEGLKSSMFVGNKVPVDGLMTDVGLAFEATVQTAQHTTALSMHVTLSELRHRRLVHTNLDMNIRLNLPHGLGALIVTPLNPTNTDNVALIVQPLR